MLDLKLKQDQEQQQLLK
jgi:hypothetical protein